jgi:hypothetical protein
VETSRAIGPASLEDALTPCGGFLDRQIAPAEDAIADGLGLDTRRHRLARTLPADEPELAARPSTR